MDYLAVPLSNCLTNTAFFMAFSAEFMYAITVILRCDAALLWRINFPLKLIFSKCIQAIISANALFSV